MTQTPTQQTTASEWLTLRELAEWLKIPVGTLYNIRHRGDGPSGVRIGGQLRFRRTDVDAWLDRCADAKVG